MITTAKVSITLSNDLMRQVAGIQKQTGETRSGVVSRALRCFLHQADETGRRRAYLAGYTRIPENAGEIEAVEALATDVLAREPWE